MVDLPAVLGAVPGLGVRRRASARRGVDRDLGDLPGDGHLADRDALDRGPGPAQGRVPNAVRRHGDGRRSVAWKIGRAHV